MELIIIIISIIGVLVAIIFGYFQLAIPFIKREIKFSKKFPFLTRSENNHMDKIEILKEKSSITEKEKNKIFSVLFTDIKGYTAYRLQNESNALDLLKKYKQIIRPIFTKYEGDEIKERGDEFFVKFSSTIDAATCAFEIQKTINYYNSSLTNVKKLNVRIGIHIGPIVHHKDEVTGQGIEIAYQVGVLSHPGGIYITEDIYRRIRSKIEAPITKLSRSELKDIHIPVNIYSVVMPWDEDSPMPYKERDSPIKIAVADFINETGERELDGLSGMLITALEQSKYLSVLTRPRMFDIMKQIDKNDIDFIDEVIGREIGRKANLNALAIASIRKFGEIYITDLKVLDPIRDKYLFTASAQGRGQECIPSVIDKISHKTRIGLEEKQLEIQTSSRSVADITSVNLESYQHYFIGEEMLNRLKFKKAIEEFKKAIELDPSFGLAYYRLAYAIDWEANSRLAKKYNDKAMSLIDNIPDKEKYLVRALNKRIEEGMEEGIAILKEMEKIYPDNKEMIYNIGDWSYHLKQYKRAIEYLEKVLEIDPHHDRALEHLIWTYRDMKKYEKMLEYSKRYVSVVGSSESYDLLAKTHILLGNFKPGLKMLKHDKKLFPERYFISGSIAKLYFFQEQYDKASLELNELIESHQKVDVKQYGYRKLADFYPYIGKYRNAIDSCNRIIEYKLKINEITEANFWRIRKAILVLYGPNNLEEAWKEAEKTFSFHNQISSASFWGGLSLLYVYHGDYKLARNTAKRHTPNIWHSVIFSLIHIKKNECDRAESFRDAISKLGSESLKILILYPLALRQLESGKLDKANDSINILQSIYDNKFGFHSVFYPKSFYLLGRIYKKKGDIELAIQNFKKFLDIWKNADKDLPELKNAAEHLTELNA